MLLFKKPINSFGNKKKFKFNNISCRFSQFLRNNWIGLLFLIFMIILLPLRSYWAPDEPDFAQAVKEMRIRGAWLFPWLNGEIYTEKPILFFWLMKFSAITGEFITGGRTFQHGISPWVLRIPSVLSGASLVFGLRHWTRRFISEDVSLFSTVILTLTPIWIWQSQFIQIDMVFSALLSWAWICWISGYSIENKLLKLKNDLNYKFLYTLSYILMSLATLAKGPLGPILFFIVIILFLISEGKYGFFTIKKFMQAILIFAAVVFPWYIIATIIGGTEYFNAMLVHQNIERALRAWDHVQPWWRYSTYLIIDFFPWSLLLPAALYSLIKNRIQLNYLDKFISLAALIPIILLSMSKSKQGKYILMCYPFISILIACYFHKVSKQMLEKSKSVTIFLFLSIGIFIAMFLNTGFFGKKIPQDIYQYKKSLNITGALFALSGLWILINAKKLETVAFFKNISIILSIIYVFIIPTAFISLEPIKGYKEWSKIAKNITIGHKIYFWNDLRSGIIIYSNDYAPVIKNANQLDKIASNDLLLSAKRYWKPGVNGLNNENMKKFTIKHEHKQGGDAIIVLSHQ